MNLASAVHRPGVRAGMVGGVSVLAAAAAVLVLYPSGASAGGVSDPTTPHRSIAAAPRLPVGPQANGPINSYSARDANDEQCTSSTAYAPIPGMSVSFTIPGRTRRHVVAMFQGEWFNNDRALAQVAVDGVVQQGPGDSVSPMALDSGNDAGSSVDQTNGFNFITDNLAPGVTHTLTVQWASVSGGSICVDERSLVVLRP